MLLQQYVSTHALSNHSIGKLLGRLHAKFRNIRFFLLPVLSPASFLVFCSRQSIWSFLLFVHFLFRDCRDLARVLRSALPPTLDMTPIFCFYFPLVIAEHPEYPLLQTTCWVFPSGTEAEQSGNDTGIVLPSNISSYIPIYPYISQYISTYPTLSLLMLCSVHMQNLQE